MLGSVNYVGWIGAASVGDRATLRELGVRGKMIYNYELECFEFCRCSDKVMHQLIQKWPRFWPRAFTAINCFGNQLPRHQQKYWTY